MSRPGVFLTAEWRNLLMLNYAVDPCLLKQYVPAGTELDTFDGRTYVSLVGFEFNSTRVCGISIPFHRSFEEVNLRFYVRRGSRRGVVFIRELVPRFAIAAVARACFGENYSSVPMRHQLWSGFEDDGVEVQYSWGSNAHRCTMWMESHEPAFLPPEDSLGHFITEHYWGYAAQRDGSCLEYEVQHPQWWVRAATAAKFSGGVERYYDPQFATILLQRPASAFLADGSPVTVFRGTRIR